MLEILYDITTLEVRAWNADDAVQGNFKPKVGQEVVIFPGGPPDFASGVFRVDLANQKIVGTPGYVSPEEKRSQAQGRAIAAIKDNKGTGPWGSILHDLAVGQGWIRIE